jgi:hypothetical protein
MNVPAHIIPLNPAASSLTHHAVNISELKAQVNLIQYVMRDVMKSGEHYGTIPGCGDKPALLKPGAEKLMLTFRLANDVDVETIDLHLGHREYRVKVTLYSPTGQRLGTGVGSCSTMESKYRFRVGPMELTNKPVPREYWDLRKENPAKAQVMIGGRGFSTKKDESGNWKIARQGEKIEHDNPADYYNTCLKMAKKRGLVDAVLTSTAASDIFTQDIEEDPDLYGQTEETGKPGAGNASTPTGSSQATRADTSSSSHEAEPVSTSEIIGYLTAKGIKMELSADESEIFAFPDFNDSSSRQWLKDHGFKWDGKAKCWHYRNA